MTRTVAGARGIAVAGNMIVDKLYPVAGMPGLGELTTITEGMAQAGGGAACNVVVDLAKLDPALPLVALGRVGADDEGDFLLDGLRRHSNIDVGRILRGGRTSFTVVMADEVTKQRTFFHYRGANARFCEQDVDFDSLDVDILHIGYILLLDALDAADDEYGTKMARLLHSARKRGIRTSVDVVSETGNRFNKVVPPALKYADYCVINEIEAQATTGIALRSAAGVLEERRIPRALEKLKELGVAQWAVIHCPEGGYGMDESGSYFSEPSLRLAKEEIAGTVGAGDAFCSGILYAAWRKQSLPEALTLANGAAACSLTRSGATEGVGRVADILAFCRGRA